MPRAELARRLVGLGLIAAGAIGLSVTVLDWSAARECVIENADRLALCASPLPSWLFGLWFLLGSLGTLLAVRR